ncbi:ketosynthase [Kitasatospora viridis]|uniref:Beta-ketoacyl synthase-like protein n=1 Tax=Kitasatospora viridis TaxID=281105 RepID=A0A561SFZ7_9ACTN|nr:ketosynthase [Kitasatospora viridis]TWF73805.1 hypothetical protein FHX73_15432 [Kitasatospora viridis]
MPPAPISHRAAVAASCLVPWGDAAAGLPGAAPVELPRIVGFAVSRFGPLVHAVATACLETPGTAAHHVGPHGAGTAIVLATVHGDAVTADTASRWTVEGRITNPLMFFQSVSTSILGQLTRRHGIHGPLTCVSAVRDPAGEALGIADALLDDPELHQVLVIGVETAPTERVRRAGESAAAAGWRHRLPAGDAAAALLLRRFDPGTGATRLTLSPAPAGRVFEEDDGSAGPLGWLGGFLALCAAVRAGQPAAHTYRLPR